MRNVLFKIYWGWLSHKFTIKDSTVYSIFIVIITILNSMKQPELIITDDGSHSLYVEELDECYHSTHGAIQESKHVFLKHGLFHRLVTIKDPAVLEIGFGTGLNCMLTFLSCSNLSYTTIEKYPISSDIVSRLNYTTEPEEVKLLRQIHDAKWGVPVNLLDNELLKFQGDIKSFDFGVNRYDVIYFDAFSPESQPDLWTEEIFRKCMWLSKMVVF